MCYASLIFRLLFDFAHTTFLLCCLLCSLSSLLYLSAVSLSPVSQVSGLSADDKKKSFLVAPDERTLRIMYKKTDIDFKRPQISLK